MSAFLPYQAAWYADPAKVRVCEKSRRIGITWAEAARQVLLASRSRSAGGMDCSYLSTSHRLGRKYIATCATWAESLGMAAKAMGSKMVGEVLAHEIHFASGFKVQALTSNPESLRGEGGDVVIDEAAHHQDLAELLKAAKAVGDWGGRLSIISTHNGIENPFNQLCEDIRSGKRAASLHRVTIHDALQAGLYRRRCLVQGIHWTAEGEAQWLSEALESWGSDEEYLVIPARSGGAYIRRDLIEECSAPTPIERLELPPEHIHKPEVERTAHITRWCQTHLDHLLKALPGERVTTVGVDFARSANGDLSVFALLTEARDLKKVCPWLVELRGVPHTEQWAILRHICKGIPRWGGVALDSGLNGGWLGETALAHFGPSQVDCVQITSHWYGENLPRFRVAFEEHQIQVPADVDVRDDILMIEIRDGIPKMRKERSVDSKSKKGRHGDSAIALALAFARHQKAPPKYELVKMPGLGDNRRGPMRKYSL